ncbi:MAG: hypothetical protein H8K03_07095 [Nitrospira sp.]|nr:hypothetical protein [Nitrospira sp. BO4]
MDTHPSDQLRKLAIELTRNPQFTSAHTKALMSILIDIADRVQILEQHLGQDY